MDSTSAYHGSCLCNAITFCIEGPIKAVTHCHCSQCRKAHGAAFASYGSVPGTQLKVSDTQGAIRVFESSPGVSRSFCSTCGATLFWRKATGDYADWVSVALGTLDTPFVPGRQKHVHVQSGLCWLDWPAPTGVGADLSAMDDKVVPTPSDRGRYAPHRGGPASR
ncbi:GFA family protein [Pseudomonas sp. GZD-222]|uniref:GFA family protein n=1 Tax=Pseudomonas sp. GZD-222 TaxID=3404805 RepID=UPI003BB62010